jgi:hypothetical protein
LIIRDVVAEIHLPRGVDRRNPDRVHSEVLQVTLLFSFAQAVVVLLRASRIPGIPDPFGAWSLKYVSWRVGLRYRGSDSGVAVPVSAARWSFAARLIIRASANF